jgi:hypothetical protein
MYGHSDAPSSSAIPPSRVGNFLDTHDAVGIPDALEFIPELTHALGTSQGCEDVNGWKLKVHVIKVIVRKQFRFTEIHLVGQKGQVLYNKAGAVCQHYRFFFETRIKMKQESRRTHLDPLKLLLLHSCTSSTMLDLLDL